MKYRTQNGYILGICVFGKEKYSGLYTPQKTSYSDYYGWPKIWITYIHPESELLASEGVGIGAVAYVRDKYEVEVIQNTPLLRYYAETAPFREEIKAELDKFGGYPVLGRLHEASLSIVEESTCQNPPISSWDQLISQKGFLPRNLSGLALES